ncbi:hypothetical protein FPV67DRAFT_1779545, partial [Lyophyllum atratum]
MNVKLISFVALLFATPVFGGWPRWPGSSRRCMNSRGDICPPDYMCCDPRPDIGGTPYVAVARKAALAYVFSRRTDWSL